MQINERIIKSLARYLTVEVSLPHSPKNFPILDFVCSCINDVTLPLIYVMFSEANQCNKLPAIPGYKQWQEECARGCLSLGQGVASLKLDSCSLIALTGHKWR